MAKTKIKSDGRTITVRVPISIKKRGGRKVVLLPDGIEHDGTNLRSHQVDNVIIKAIARAFRWREMLERGECSTIKEIAALERINQSYVARILRLTLLAPDIVEAFIAGRQPPDITLPSLMKRLRSVWSEQRSTLRLELEGR